MTNKELQELRRIWVGGAFPTTGKRQTEAALVIDDLIQECFRLRGELWNIHEVVTNSMKTIV